MEGTAHSQIETARDLLNLGSPARAQGVRLHGAAAAVIHGTVHAHRPEAMLARVRENLVGQRLTLAAGAAVEGPWSAWPPPERAFVGLTRRHRRLE